MPRAIIYIMKLQVAGGRLKIAHSKSSDKDAGREIFPSFCSASLFNLKKKKMIGNKLHPK